MHIDARKLDSDSIIEGDVCIIGAGTAGISIALDWINTPYKVILLEGGGFEYDSKVQALNDGESTGHKYYPLQSTRLRWFGGTTGHWAGYCSPMDDIDFKKRDFVPYSGWSIEKKDISPYYKRADKVFQNDTNGYNYNNYWRNIIDDRDPLPFDEEIIWNKIWKFSDSRFGKLYKDTIVNAKNIHLYTYANAVNISANDDVSSIRQVTVKNYAGKTHTVKAKYFILACGTIQNTRLLLASNSQAKQGLGNNFDLVGRFFMEHLEIASGEIWLTKSLDTIYTHPSGKIRVSSELAITEKAQIENQILNGTVSFQPLFLDRKLKTHMETWQNKDPRIAQEDSKHHDASGRAKRAFELYTRLEQAPNPNSRITLGNEKDEFGVPKANLHWQFTAGLEKRSIRKIIQIIGQQVGISGVARVKLLDFLRDEQDDTMPETTNGGWHHMGTTRMHADPKKGVVDTQCKVHGISNLFVAGSSCYTTSGAVNPTLTLVAFALRVSDYVKSKLNST